MADFFARMALGSLWALIWHFGIIAGIMILALLAAWFMPMGKKAALLVALCAAIMLATASVYTKLGANYVQAKWDAAQKADYATAKDARAKAERSIPPLDRSKPHAPRLHHDRYNRDN